MVSTDTINNNNQNRLNIKRDSKSKGKLGFLYSAGKVLAVSIPMLCVLSITHYIISFSPSIKPENHLLVESSLSTIISLFNLVFMILITSFWVVCVYIVSRTSILRFAKKIALALLFFSFGATIVVFSYEIVFGGYLYHWTTDCLVDTLIFIFYYQMVKARIKLVTMKEQAIREIEDQESDTHNYYLPVLRLFKK